MFDHVFTKIYQAQAHSPAPDTHLSHTARPLAVPNPTRIAATRILPFWRPATEHRPSMRSLRTRVPMCVRVVVFRSTHPWQRWTSSMSPEACLPNAAARLLRAF